MLVHVVAELRAELGMEVKGQDDGMTDKDEAWVNSCGSCCHHCILDCCCCRCCVCLGCMPSQDENDKKIEVAVPGSLALLKQDIKHTFAGGKSYGMLHNSVGMIAKNWGFDPRNCVSGKTKVMVSYNEGDLQSPTPHGKFLADTFTEKAAAIKINFACNETKGQANNHGAQMVKQFNGEFIQMMAELDASDGP